MARGPLDRYFRILDGEEKARYLQAKETIVEEKLSTETEVLWDVLESKSILRADAGSRTSLLDLKLELAKRMLTNCVMCERRCGADRRAGKMGHCGVLDARISSEFLHMGEEPELVPSYTIFFSGCTFNCVFCQNWDISTRPGGGAVIAPKRLAKMIEAKEQSVTAGHVYRSAKNVNWVGGDPTSNIPFILEVLKECRANLPQVWNSNMYLSVESMRLLDGVIDVYLTDFKYGNDECAMRLSHAPDYTRTVKRNHLMARENGEMVIRHLVLPGHVECCTRPALNWIAENLPSVKVNVMAQYHPEHRAREFEDIAKPLGVKEFKEAIEIAEDLELDLTG